MRSRLLPLAGVLVVALLSACSAREQADEPSRAPSDTTPAPDAAPDTTPQPDTAPGPSPAPEPAPAPEAPSQDGGLQDLLDQLLGSAGLPDIDPACVADAMGRTGQPEPRIEGDVRQQVEAITPLVEDQRGLRFDKAVAPEFLASNEFEQQLSSTVESEYPAEQADLDARVLELLGAIPRDTDLKALQNEVLAGQVAGYYDPDTGRTVVRVPDGSSGLDANGQVTLAHELNHALTDQILGLPDTEQEGASDANLARIALVEGDATLLMQQFSLGSIGLLDQLGAAFSPDALAAQGQLENVPSYLRNELMFPYLSGLGYVCRLYAEGGWPAVDAAYRELPQTTAEVLFPEDAGAAPEDPRDAASPGAGWTKARSDTLGAAPLLWLMQAPGGDEAKAIDAPADAARHWAGGELALFTSGEQSALGLALVDKADGGVLCTAIEDWYTAAFDTARTEDGGTVMMDGGDQVGALHCDGRDVRLGIGPDEATAAALAS